MIKKYHSGAVEACWAHNPKVRGSKPLCDTTGHSSDGRAGDCSNNWISLGHWFDSSCSEQKAEMPELV